MKYDEAKFNEGARGIISFMSVHWIFLQLTEEFALNIDPNKVAIASLSDELQWERRMIVGLNEYRRESSHSNSFMAFFHPTFNMFYSKT